MPAAVVLLLIVAACGGDDDPVSTTAAAPATTTEAPGAVATTQPPEDPGTDAGEDRTGELVGRWEVVNYVLPGGGGLTNVVGEEFVVDGDRLLLLDEFLLIETTKSG